MGQYESMGQENSCHRKSLIRTGGGPSQSPSSSQDGAIISMVEDAAPVMICDIKNSFDSGGVILSTIESQEVDLLTTENHSQATMKEDPFDIVTEEEKLESGLTTVVLEKPQIVDMHLNTEQSGYKYTTAIINNQDQSRRPADYIRQEAVLRIKHLECKKKIETQILKTQLEVEESRKEVEDIRKRAALLEEERGKILLEKAKIELLVMK